MIVIEKIFPIIDVGLSFLLLGMWVIHFCNDSWILWRNYYVLSSTICICLIIYLGKVVSKFHCVHKYMLILDAEVHSWDLCGRICFNNDAKSLWSRLDIEKGGIPSSPSSYFNFLFLYQVTMHEWMCCFSRLPLLLLGTPDMMFNDNYHFFLSKGKRHS